MVRLKSVQLAVHRAPPTEPSTLQVTAKRGAGLVTVDVYLDGKKIGETPLAYGGVAPGRHRLEARREGVVHEVKQIWLQPGKKTKVVFRLLR